MPVRILILSFVLWVSCSVSAQTTYIPLWAKEGWLLDRMEIKAATHDHLNLSVVKPLMRKVYVETADSVRVLLLRGQNAYNLSKVDQYNLDRFQANNSEYSRFDTTSMPAWKSKKDFLGFLWPTKGNMVEVNTKDFYLSLNPAINQQQSIETGFDRRVFVNAKGVILRGLIGRKIGFHMYVTDNQEQGPIQFRQYVDSNLAVPGAGLNKNFKKGTGRDYFDARGSVTWNVTRYVNMQFGFDQHFIGAGYRSLFISSFAPPNLFLKFNTRFKKFNYTNIFSELYPPQLPGGDRLNPKQYSATHHLSFNAAPWLNIGAFETVVFDELSSFKLQYLQPVIFFNSLIRDREGKSGSFIGFDAKANILRHIQLYGQVLIQGYNGTEKPADNNSWASRHGFQGGIKYVDAFGVKNLDLQAEYNQVRPFTYSGMANQGSWTNYKQPMAHPFGANFREAIGILRYQPFNRVYLFARINYWEQGRDSARFNFGSNPRLDNALVGRGGTRLREAPYDLLAGTGYRGVNTAITLSYEWKENLFIDLNNLYRLYKPDKGGIETNTNVVTIGLRWNMFRRDYDY